MRKTARYETGRCRSFPSLAQSMMFGTLCNVDVTSLAPRWPNRAVGHFSPRAPCAKDLPRGVDALFPNRRRSTSIGPTTGSGHGHLRDDGRANLPLPNSPSPPHEARSCLECDRFRVAIRKYRQRNRGPDTACGRHPFARRPEPFRQHAVCWRRAPRYGRVSGRRGRCDRRPGLVRQRACQTGGNRFGSAPRSREMAERCAEGKCGSPGHIRLATKIPVPLAAPEIPDIASHRNERVAGPTDHNVSEGCALNVEHMLTIDTDDFRLQMEPVAARRDEPGGPYLEWIDVRIQLTVPSIQAEGQWSVMPDELRQFRQQIQSIQTQLQAGQQAELTGVEPGFELILRTLDRRAIVGDWRFQPPPPEGACITGYCGLDQSFLPELLQGIESLLSFRGTRKSP